MARKNKFPRCQKAIVETAHVQKAQLVANPLTAFVLGAGLGTRLRPLTDTWPKPLLPVRGRPLIQHIFDRLLETGVKKILVNTHHCPERYAEVFPVNTWQGVPLIFEHEPLLLDTAGGLKNIARHWTDEQPLLLHNGDILTTLPLQKLLHAHGQLRSHNNVLCTLALRSRGGPRHVQWCASSGLICDIRNTLPGSHADKSRHVLYTGIAIIEKKFLELIPEKKVIGLVPVWLQAISKGLPIGGALIDEGEWHDIGDLETYHQLNSCC